jgi:hypothetical protein
MRFRVVGAGAGALIACSCLVFWQVSRRPSANEEFHGRATPEEAPEIAPSGPYPRAVVDQAEFDFGRMESGETGEHAFTIRNDGEAPLTIRRGATTCHCTMSELERGQLAVGTSAKITLKWKPSGQTRQFGHSASILTNDPANRVVELKIVGMVVSRLETFPGQNWEAPDMAVDRPTVFTGLVISPVVDQFHVLAMTSASPCVTAECLPIEPEQLQERNGRSGYQIRVSISPDLPLGAFSLPLTIKTDLPERNADGKLGEGMDVEVLVSGRRRGPLRIVGREWDEEQMAIAMGAFKAAEGRKVNLMVFVRGDSAQGLHLTEPPLCHPQALKAILEPDPKAAGKHARYRLTLEYPPGAPRALFLKDQSASVRLRTNHPGARQVDLQVYLNAQ